MNAITPVSPQSGVLHEARTFRALVYRLGKADFATEVSQVQEIVRPNKLLQPAKILDNFEGLLKRRGRLVPVVDLRRRLGFPVGPRTPETCAVIAKLPIGTVGFIVDGAVALRRITLAEVETPSLILTHNIARVDEAFILGLALHEGQVITILDLIRVLSAQDQAELAGVVTDV